MDKYKKFIIISFIILLVISSFLVWWVLYPHPIRKGKDKSAFDKVNEIRAQYNMPTLKWDERVYDLALFRARDMYERKYVGHYIPIGDELTSSRKLMGVASPTEGRCVDDFKGNFDLENYIIAENVHATGKTDEIKTKGFFAKMSIAARAVGKWMESEGHKYNLLFEKHTKGAIACYYGSCIFIGARENSIDPGGYGAGDCEKYSKDPIIRKTDQFGLPIY